MSLYRLKKSARVTSWLAVVAMTIQPQLVLAEQSAGHHPFAEARRTVAQDIALGEGGVLQGQVINAQGAPVANSAVSLRAGGLDVAQAHTDSQGVFRVGGLQGGTYEVATEGQQGVYRLWAPHTAPPSALAGLTVVAGEEVLRGQYAPAPGGPFTAAGQWIAEHPLLTAGIIAAAIAVPIAVSNSSSSSNSNPPATP